RDSSRARPAPHRRDGRDQRHSGSSRHGPRRALPHQGGGAGRRHDGVQGKGKRMKLHDLKPAPGSRKARTRVGRGIAAGQGKASDQPVVTVNAEVLANAGLIRGDDKPLKVLGQGEVSQKLFVAAEAFSASARKKIEEAGGFVQLLAEPAQAETSASETSSELE